MAFLEGRRKCKFHGEKSIAGKEEDSRGTPWPSHPPANCTPSLFYPLRYPCDVPSMILRYQAIYRRTIAAISDEYRKDCDRHVNRVCLRSARNERKVRKGQVRVGITPTPTFPRPRRHGGVGAPAGGGGRNSYSGRRRGRRRFSPIRSDSGTWGRDAPVAWDCRAFAKSSRAPSGARRRMSPSKTRPYPARYLEISFGSLRTGPMRRAHRIIHVGPAGVFGI